MTHRPEGFKTCNCVVNPRVAWGIEYCPLHKAAEELLAAAKEALSTLKATGLSELTPALFSLRTAIAKAEDRNDT